MPVGAVVLAITAAGDADAAPSAPTAAEKPAPTPSAPTATTVPIAPTAATPIATPQVVAALPAPATRTADERIRATPATRKLARTLGVDIGRIAGTGDHGRVTREDVQNWATQVAQASEAPAENAAKPASAPRAIVVSADDEVRKIIGLRRRISDNMRASKAKSAHFTYVDEVDFTEISKLKRALREAGLRTTYLPFVMKAVVTALKDPEFEMLNAWTDYDAGTITLKRSYHLGIAAATDAGLLVPVVFDVDKKSMRTLVDELGEVGEGARTSALPVSRLSGSTFTITSLGKLGGMFATPIINAPETAILGLHKIEKRPVVVNDQIVIRERMYMSCSFDHRMIDGHIGAAFVQQVKTLLESPGLLMAELA